MATSMYSEFRQFLESMGKSTIVDAAIAGIDIISEAVGSNKAVNSHLSIPGSCVEPVNKDEYFEKPAESTNPTINRMIAGSDMAKFGKRNVLAPEAGRTTLGMCNAGEQRVCADTATSSQ